MVVIFCIYTLCFKRFSTSVKDDLVVTRNMAILKFLAFVLLVLDPCRALRLPLGNIGSVVDKKPAIVEDVVDNVIDGRCFYDLFSVILFLVVTSSR